MFQKRFQGDCRAPEAWRILRLVFLKKPDARLEKGLRGFRAVVLLCVNCEHMQILLTNLLQKHWEWQEIRRMDLEPCNFKTMYMASLDVKTAFDVAKPSVVLTFF